MPATTAPARLQTSARTNATRHSVVVPLVVHDPELANSEHEARRHRERQRDAARLENAQRHATLISAAGEAGRNQGFKAGYMEGWHWGLTCGVVAGLAGGVAGTLLVQWLHAFSAGVL